MDMDIPINIHVTSLDMDRNINRKCHIYGKPGSRTTLDFDRKYLRMD